MNKIYYDTIDIAEGIVVNKTNELKECDLLLFVFSK